MNKKIFFSGIFLIIASSWLVTDFLISSHNILYKNEHWIPFRMSYFGLRGQALDSILDRRMISDGKLREHRLRVFSKKEMHPRKISFQFRLQEHSFVDVIFNADDKSYEGIRISNEKWRPSFQFKTLHSGEYLWKKPVNYTPSGNHSIEAILRSINGKLQLSLDRDKLILDGQLLPGRIGFDLSGQAQIWDPEIETNDGEVINAPFVAKENSLLFFIVHLLFLTMVIVFLVLILRNSRERVFLRATGFLFGICLLINLFDKYYYSKKVFRFNGIDYTFENRDEMAFDFEKVRFKILRKWFISLGGEHPSKEELRRKNLWPLPPFNVRHCLKDTCTTYFPPSQPGFKPKTKNDLRFMVWGGSMSAGQGLMSMEESYPDLIFHDLRKAFPEKNVELINSSKRAREYELNFNSLEKDIKGFRPDVLLVDFLMPLTNPESMEPLIKLMAGNVKLVIFLRLPISYERYQNVDLNVLRSKLTEGLQPRPQLFYSRNDPLFIKWRDQYGLKFVDANSELLSEDVIQSGDLFWDPMHLTAWGHEVWAEILSKKIIPLVNKTKF